MERGHASLDIYYLIPNLKKWRQKAQETAYTSNISYYRAIKMTPYEAVYDIKSHRGVYTSQNSEANQDVQTYV